MFCLKYYPNKPYLKKVKELKIDYRAADNTLEDFLKAYSNSTIIINIENEFNMEAADVLSNLYKNYKNFKVAFYYHNESALELVQHYNLPFFFLDSVTNIDTLYGLMAYKPTDMYICEDLGFNLEKISDILHSNNIRVRVYPNICQSSFPTTPSLQTFFIRPEDIPFYEKYVDVFELIADEERQFVIYKAYFENTWFGKIKELIPTFKDELDSRYLVSFFGMFRVNCGKRCLYKPGSCNICGELTKNS